MQTLTAMSIEVQLKDDRMVEKFAKFLCHELGVFPGRITIASHEAEDGNLGLCIDESEDEFIILVKEGNRNIGEVFTTIAHEIIHVKQYMKENLSWFLANRSHIPYMERWWEKEAFTGAVPLVEKFAKTL
jgi:hypothetical protein